MPNPNDAAVALAANDQQRLIQFLGMTGSVFDGEALNAVRLANRTIKTAGMTWADIVVDKSPIREPQAYGYIPPLYPGEAKLLRAVTVYRCVTPSAEQLWRLRGIADRVLTKAPPT